MWQFSLAIGSCFVNGNLGPPFLRESIVLLTAGTVEFRRMDVESS